MPPIEDHELRYGLANELHARPFPSVEVPSRAVFLAIKQPHLAAQRDRDGDRLHLLDLLDRYGADHPSPGATHYYGRIGRAWLKWESHTEFVTYMAVLDGVGERPFDPSDFEIFPDDWLNAAPGVRLTSAHIRIEPRGNQPSITESLDDWFVPESLAVSNVLDNQATIAGDFRIDPAGHMRFAVFAADGTGQRRLGRVIQRITEIEVYKSMSMLGLARIRRMGPKLSEMDKQANSLISGLTNTTADPEETLALLLQLSAELEGLSSDSEFRFSATEAYQALVHQRIEVLRETRFEGRQTFREFMMRRFDPAMRTVRASQKRLDGMANRAFRAGDLLQTRVDVARQAQNQKVLESMDQRADLQLRLQKTVEGLSVVAISYYAVSLVIYALGPLAVSVGVSKSIFGGAVTPIVVFAVWLAVRRIRQSMDH